MLSQLAFRILKHYTIPQILAFLKRLPILTAWTVGTLLVLVIGLEIIWIIVVSPLWQAIQLTQNEGVVGLFEVANIVQPQILESLKAVLPGLSGLALSGTAFAAIRNLKATEDSRKLTEEKQVTDLLVEAVKMLADRERIEVRIGGVYILERIAKNSTRDHWTVMEVLTTFIQKDISAGSFLKLMLGPKITTDKNSGDEVAPADIQAALVAIGRRDVNKDPEDRRRLRLVKANFNAVLLEPGTNFHRAFLAGSSFIGASLPMVIFTDAVLRNADLKSAILMGADFTDANLKLADFRSAFIGGAILINADLEGADLRGVRGREAAQIVAAKNWWLAEYDDEFAQELTEFVQKQAEHDPKFVEQLRLFEQNRQAQNEEPENPSDTPG